MTISDKSVLVQRYINSAYDKVLAVYNNLASITLVANNIAGLTGTAADAIATAADVVSTNADVVTTNADVVLTDADVVAAAASAAAALVSENAAATSYDDFDDRYLGVKVAAPTVDNDGNALVSGAMYFLLTTDTMYVRNSFSAWQAFFSNAAAVSNTPAGDIVATDVQAAINELDTEKAKLAGDIAQAFAASTVTANLNGILGGVTPAAANVTTLTAATGVAVGGATAGAGGVVFPATAVPSAGANTLDDYQEGTWAPTLQPDTGSIALQTAYDTLSYTKIGRCVHITGNLRTLSATSPVGNISMITLPFVSASQIDQSAAIGFHLAAVGLNAALVNHLQGIIQEASTTVTITETNGTSNIGPGPKFTVGGGVNLYFDFTYNTDL